MTYTNMRTNRSALVLILAIILPSCAVQSTNDPPPSSATDIAGNLRILVNTVGKHIAETPDRIARTGSAISGPVYQGYFNGHFVTCQPGGVPTYSNSRGIGFNPLPGLCDALIKSGQVRLVDQGSAGDKAAPTETVPADYRSIEQTEIYRIFEKYPQPGGGAFAAWPRVAITLIDAPPWHLEDKIKRGPYGMVAGTKSYPSDGCWKFKAKIWESATKSHDVAPFYHCTRDQLRMPVNNLLIAYDIWSGLQGSSFTRTKSGSTGIQRTDGPTYPDTPLPNSMPYQRANFGSSFTADIACGTLGATGIDFTVLNDYRVWLNLAPAMEPK